MTIEIDAAALTTFEVATDGSWVRLNVLDRENRAASLVLPAACVNQLLMTIPRMVEAALRNSQGDDSLRFVHPMERFALELAGPEGGGEPHLILTIQTEGGFKASFGAGQETMMQLGHAIVEHTIAHDPVPAPSVLLS